MEPMTLQATAEDAGKRLDAWLAEQTGLSRSALQRLAEEGQITSEGRPLAKNARLTGSETVTVSRPAPEAIDVVPQNIPLEVVYEDADVIVVNKPKGLVVHPAPGHPDGTLVNALLYHCGESLSGINGELRPGIVHRIDRDTSGLIIAAKNDTARCAPRGAASGSTRWPGPTAALWWEDSGRTAARWTRLSAGAPPTERRWRWCPAGGGP